MITNSSEYYDLSYEYLNDCLRAGIVYRREFYNDSELEPENSLMFKLTFIPFGDIDTPPSIINEKKNYYFFLFIFIFQIQYLFAAFENKIIVSQKMIIVYQL